MIRKERKKERKKTAYKKFSAPGGKYKMGRRFSKRNLKPAQILYYFLCEACKGTTKNNKQSN
jgi:hypothetical protein